MPNTPHLSTDALGSSSRLDEEIIKNNKSHAQLSQTASNVRIINQNLFNATIKINIKTIMIVTKPGDMQLVKLTNALTSWLLDNYDYLVVYVDSHLQKLVKVNIPNNNLDATRGQALNSLDSNDNHKKEQMLGRLKFWSQRNFENDENYCDLFDLVITLGGDGTVLFVSQLFQTVVPPIIAFSLGSLGFLTNFKFKNYQRILTKILRLKYVKTNLRLRLSCEIVHAKTNNVVMSRNILNEITIDRGSNPFLTNLALYGDDSLITVAQADGLCIATPTGSTAYSLAAGGSLVHSSVSAISVTPICPHTLSFRPIILPDSMELKVVIPRGSRCETSWASFDGKSRFKLNKDYYVVIRASKYYFPTVMNGNNEYFESVSKNLNWNSRKLQKPLRFVDNYNNSDDERLGSLSDVEGESVIITDDDFEETDTDDNSDGYGTASFYQQNEISSDDDDYIETPTIPFHYINEALEIFSDEEHDKPSNSSRQSLNLDSRRSISNHSSRKIRTNSFTNFNQIYREKLHLDTSSVSNKLHNLKINSGSSLSIGRSRSRNNSAVVSPESIQMGAIRTQLLSPSQRSSGNNKLLGNPPLIAGAASASTNDVSKILNAANSSSDVATDITTGKQKEGEPIKQSPSHSTNIAFEV